MESKRIGILSVGMVFIALCASYAVGQVLPFNDPRYAEYKQIRDRYQQLWYDYGVARNDATRRQAIVRDVQAIHRRLNELRQQDSVSNPNSAAYSDELASRLGRLYLDSSWDINLPANDQKRRYTKQRSDGTSYNPYQRYQGILDLYDEISATLARPGITAAQRTAARDRMQREVVTPLDSGISAISGDANANNEVLQMLRNLRADAARVGSTTADTNRPKSLDSNRDSPKPVVPTGPREVEWRTTATAYRGQRVRVTYLCPPNSVSQGSVWGTDIYTDDSSVCQAAVHFGLITHRSGGRVTFEMRLGTSSYRGSMRNGVSTAGYGSWPGSYVFVGR